MIMTISKLTQTLIGLAITAYFVLNIWITYIAPALEKLNNGVLFL